MLMKLQQKFLFFLNSLSKGLILHSVKNAILKILFSFVVTLLNVGTQRTSNFSFQPQNKQKKFTNLAQWFSTLFFFLHIFIAQKFEGSLTFFAR